MTRVSVATIETIMNFPIWFVLLVWVLVYSPLILVLGVLGLIGSVLGRKKLKYVGLSYVLCVVLILTGGVGFYFRSGMQAKADKRRADLTIRWEREASQLTFETFDYDDPGKISYRDTSSIHKYLIEGIEGESRRSGIRYLYGREVYGFK